MRQQGVDLDALRQRKMETYNRFLQEKFQRGEISQMQTLDEQGADREIVAEYMEKNLLTNETAIREFVKTDRGFVQKILDAINKVLAKLGSKDAKERAWLQKVSRMYAQALQETQGDFAENEETGQREAGRELNNAEDVIEATKGLVEFSVDDQESAYDGKSMSEDSEIYTYDFLASLNNMQVVTLPEVSSVRNADGRIDQEAVVQEGMKNARSVGTERDGEVLVRNRYTKRLLKVTSNSIRHGLNGDFKRILTNARIGTVAGDIVKNAVPINALHNEAKNVTGTYAMAGYATDSSGREFVAIITVEQRNGNVSDVEVYDVTHAVGGRQKKTSGASTKLQSITSTTAGGISIADLLGIVKQTHQSILSKDVLNHFGEERNSGGYYSDRVRYSFGGENARGADLEALKQAKQMREEGVAEDVILRQTGWYTGADGKWRFEIDDSGMKYRRGGDAQFRQDHPENSASEAEYSINEGFKEDIAEWDTEGRPDGEMFLLGSTGEVLRGLGATDGDICILSEKINEILGKHAEMTIAEIKEIPKILDDPILVLKSQNKNRAGKQNTRVVIFGSVIAKNGKPILSVLDLAPTEKRLHIVGMQKVNSAYAKDSDPVGWLVGFVLQSDAMYLDKKRATHLLSAIGFQMPIACNQSGFLGSIAYKGREVKLEGVPMRKILGSGTETQQTGWQNRVKTKERQCRIILRP